MPNITRYPEDRTGVNPNNLVYNEPHVLENHPKRVFCPNYGPFYKTGAILIDDATGQALTYGADYKFGVYHREASAKFVQDIYEVVIVLNGAVSENVSFTYQNVGGNYQNSAYAIAQLYQGLLLDNRAVDWENLLNKPTMFTPTALHPHFLEDVTGFDPLIVKIEQLINALTMTNVPAFEALVEWVRNRTNFATNSDVQNLANSDGIITLNTLKYATRELAFNSIFIAPDRSSLFNSDQLRVVVTHSNLDRSTPYLWTIEHITTTDADFTSLSGPLSFTRGTSVFYIQSRGSTINEAADTFRIAIRRNSINGPILMMSDVLMIREEVIQTIEDTVIGHYFINDPTVLLTPETFLLLG